MFVTVGALGSLPGGRLVQHIGARRAIPLVATTSAISLLGIAVFADTYQQLVAWLMIGGAANALLMPTTALALSDSVSPARQGLAFGIANSATPAATLFAGLAVPLLALTVGWRWAYVAAAVAAILLVSAVRRSGITENAIRRNGAEVDSGTAPIVVFAFAQGLGSASVSALVAFFVESAVSHGVAAGTAGLWFAVGSGASIAMRSWRGWRIDQRQGRDLRESIALMALGSIGFALLAQSDDHFVLFAFATILAFGAGWGWPGLFQLGVVRRYPSAPAKATGITMTGGLAGSAVGPLIFGILAERLSYLVAWWAAAAALLAASLLIPVGTRLDARARPVADRAEDDA